MKQIKFSELVNYDDNNSFIIAGIDPDLTVEEADNFFHETQFLNDETHVLDIIRLSDNVLGDEGRTDLVFVVNKYGMNPMIRLNFRMSGLAVMWTSDFKDNYAKDYISQL